jgi:hypothetical protein
MKRILLFSIPFAFTLAASAQTVVFEDNFDSYTAGGFLASQSGDWTTWTGQPGSAEDATISNSYAASANNSCYIQNDGVDLVKEIGPFTSGKYDMKFKMYIPTGNGGYFNLLHDWGLDEVYEWAVDVYFSSTGAITWTSEMVDGGGATFPADTWFDVQITADMDADWGAIYIDGQNIHTWNWSINNGTGAVGLNAIQAIDFFGYQPVGSGPGNYYIDDFQIVESTTVSVNENNAASFSIYPNPATDRFYVETANNNAAISIYDLSGKLVESSTLNNKQNWISVAGLSEGIYLVEVLSGD